MYHLLIVDDEASVVESLALTIPWEEHGIEEVHLAYSAEEALQIAEKVPIDVMITDIRMPEMDGLELIGHMRSLSSKVRSIILSGHDEFEYAQKAIRYQTLGYLLKPVDIGELIDAVRKAIVDIEEEWAEISSYQRIKHTLHANMPLLRNQLLSDLLQNKPIEPKWLEERLDMIDVSFRLGDPYLMMVVRLEEDFSGYDLHSLSLLEYAVSNIAEEVFEELFELWHGVTEQGYLVFLIKSGAADGLVRADSYAIKLQNHVHKYLKGSLSVCLSKIGTFPSKVADSYQASVAAINRNVGKNKSYFITVEGNSVQSEDSKVIQLYEPPLLPVLLQSGSWDEASVKISRMLALDDPSSEPSRDHLLAVFLYLSSSFTTIMASEGLPIEETLGEEFDLLLRKKSQLSRQRIFEWADKIIASLKVKASNQLEDSHQQIASKVRTYIQGHLAEGISLQTVADHVGLHPVYLSKVYKSATGETIGDLLYRIRMERAAYLLRNTDMKIAEISSELGFLAAPHFIKIFKKHYGSTPQEYRNKS
ncbi:response regulator [Paenibacillus soyae]|uniref:Response regulator n=1 Tax=Paenibacillus soyae TaxID=2969249 RepID=A0A9X2MSR4_9BACL|nr:response regulator [Paenibacillus soyae]MCR2806261.1 response regulator [Paenibacillus soyae]